MSVNQNIKKTRNIGIMAHIDAGKTTVSERILFYSGRTYRISEVHDGEATMDFMDQERERGITISSAVNEISWKEHEIFLIDTPGHVDFTVEVERSLRVLDGVVALYDAVSGVEPQSETVWYQANRYKLARIGFINKMDRPGADFDRCVKEITEVLGGNAIAIQQPIFDADQNFIGMIDLLSKRAYFFDEDDQGASILEDDMPEHMVAKVEKARERLIEALADLDDEIALAYLEDVELTVDELKRALRKATIASKCIPILCGSGLKNKGIQPLMDAIIDYLPAPCELSDLEGLDAEGNAILHSRSSSASFCGLVFKLQQIESKKLAFLRVYSGSLKEGDTVLISGQKAVFKPRQIYRLNANRLVRTDSAEAGSLIAIQRVKGMVTGDTLCEQTKPIFLEKMQANSPVISIAIELESLKDKDRLHDALKVINEEDPTLIYEENEDTGELILRGMGELHLEVVVERLKREFNVNVRKGQPNVVMKEGLMEAAEEAASFERMGDNEQLFGEVCVTVRPKERGTGISYGLDLAEDHPYIRPDHAQAILEAARDAMLYGPNGYEMEDVDMRVTSIALDAKGNLNLVGSRIAAGEAVRNAYKNAGVKLLEPLMRVEVFAAEEHTGDLIFDITQRGGIVEKLDADVLRSVIHAVVPLKNMFGYTMKLRSLTHGRGSFSMSFLRFDAL